MTAKKLKTFGVYSFLTLVTLSAPLGHFLQSSALLKFGLASLASPLMIVYSELSGQRVMSFQYELILTDENNSSKIIELDKFKYNHIASHENQFNRHIMILPYMGGTFLLTTEGKNSTLREKTLRYGLCENGPYAKYLDLNSKVKHVKVKIYKDKLTQEIINEYELSC